MNFPFEHVDIQGRGMCELILPFTLVEITQILWEEGLNLAVCALPTIQERMLSFASRSIPASLTTDPHKRCTHAGVKKYVFVCVTTRTPLVGANGKIHSIFVLI